MSKIYVKKLNEVYMTVDSSEEIEKEIDDHFSFFVPGYKYMAKFKAGIWDGKIKLFNMYSKKLYLGLLEQLKEFSELNDYEIVTSNLQSGSEYSKEYIEKWIESQVLTSGDDIIELRDYQYQSILNCLLNKRQLIVCPTGCHTRGSGILINDGTFKNVEDIIVGDILVGDDGTPRNVLEIISGEGKIYKITPKKGGVPLKVNEDHILSLKFTNGAWKEGNRNKIINISVKDYLIQNKTFKHETKLRWNNIELEFSNNNDPFEFLDPYFCGLYLGDGHTHTIALTNMDEEVIEYVKEFVNNRFQDMSVDIRPTKSRAYTIQLLKGRGYENPIAKEFSKYGLIFKNTKSRTLCSEKFIPIEWKISSISNRYLLLAGLIDSDGCLENDSYFTYTTKSKTLAEDVKFISSSLGFRSKIRLKKIKSTVYYIVSISGSIEKIPVKIKRKIKKSENRDRQCEYNTQGFDVEYVGIDKYYGFVLDGNNLYLTDDFLITHNSGKSLIQYCISKFLVEHDKRVLLQTDTTNLVSQMYKDWIDYSQQNKFNVEENVQMIYGTFDREITKPITLSTWQSQNSERKKDVFNHFNDIFDAILQDECHKATAGSITSILEACSDIEYRMGFTGSLKKSKTDKLQLQGLLGKIFKPVTTRELIDRGELANIDIKLLMLQYGKEVHKFLKETKYQEQIQWILNHSNRNKFIINLAATQKGNKLVLFHSEDHGMELLRMAKEMYPNIQMFFINGGIETDERELIRETIEGLSESITFGSFGTVSQGWSVKNLHNLILAHPWKAPIKIIQSIGRVLRISKTKKSCNLYDLCDIVTTGKRDYLKRHAQERVEIYISEELNFKSFEVNLLTT